MVITLGCVHSWGTSAGNKRIWRNKQRISPYEDCGIFGKPWTRETIRMTIYVLSQKRSEHWLNHCKYRHKRETCSTRRCWTIKAHACINKPIHDDGMTTLDLSNLHMYLSCYNNVLPLHAYSNKFAYADTRTNIIHEKTDGIYNEDKWLSNGMDVGACPKSS